MRSLTRKQINECCIESNKKKKKKKKKKNRNEYRQWNCEKKKMFYCMKMLFCSSFVVRIRSIFVVVSFCAKIQLQTNSMLLFLQEKNEKKKNETKRMRMRAGENKLMQT